MRFVRLREQSASCRAPGLQGPSLSHGLYTAARPPTPPRPHHGNNPLVKTKDNDPLGRSQHSRAQGRAVSHGKRRP
ncbi:hypothetical protein NDU88_005012 [Pleurodeles waltl]|uniref:Uncharacterized protein n=1 Tax=Pleurodeles waltl TaxID=8319 RepID=A0AAV7LLL1_PLEWA|nr:hypothetical protein NDU88_005012 [Pleurodeles waltl]